MPISPETVADDAAATQPTSAQRLIDLRVIVLTIVILAACYVARAFLLPLMAAALLSYALVPAVRMLVRIHIPRLIASFVVVVAFFGIIALAIALLSAPALDLLKATPASLERIEAYLDSMEGPVSSVSEASEQIDRMTESEGDEVVVRLKEKSLAEIALSQTPRFIGGVVSTFLLLLFLLAFGDAALRNAVEAAPRLRDKKRSIEIARSLERNVSRYLVTVTVINICLGIVVGFALYLLGFDNPLLWGTLAMTLNFVPYLGAVVGVGLLGLAALGTGAPVSEAMIYPAVYLVCTLVEGNFITPMILGRSFTINPIFIIIALLFLGWLWGIAGAMMSVPILVALKTLCETSEGGQKFATLLHR